MVFILNLKCLKIATSLIASDDDCDQSDDVCEQSESELDCDQSGFDDSEYSCSIIYSYGIFTAAKTDKLIP